MKAEGTPSGELMILQKDHNTCMTCKCDENNENVYRESMKTVTRDHDGHQNAKVEHKTLYGDGKNLNRDKRTHFTSRG